MTSAYKTHRLVASANSDNATVAFDAPALLLGIQGFNAKASTVYLKLYDKKTAPSSADTPRKVLAIPASAAFVFDINYGVEFSIGLSYRLVTGSADNDNTAVLANDILALNLDVGDGQ